MNKLLTLLFLICSNSFAGQFYPKEKTFEGTFIIITKSKYCELVKSYSLFRKDHSFEFYSTCNGVDYKQFTRKNAWRGHWSMPNDSILEVSIPKRATMEFKILSDSLIELQNGGKFNRPQYRREFAVQQ
jgi:hypothetical protein